MLYDADAADSIQPRIRLGEPKCSAMHWSLRVYSFRRLIAFMTIAEKLVNIESGMLKRIAMMHENGISMKEISKELDVSIRTTKRILQLLGYLVE